MPLKTAQCTRQGGNEGSEHYPLDSGLNAEVLLLAGPQKCSFTEAWGTAGLSVKVAPQLPFSTVFNPDPNSEVSPAIPGIEREGPEHCSP